MSAPAVSVSNAGHPAPGFTPPKPVTRKLRIFAFDPSLATRTDFAHLSRVTVSIPWEDLTEGPVGKYIEVVDIDPASGMAWLPVNLNAPEILATDGLHPSEGVPQFHQQMVYAVAMTTIKQFENALGRVALWAPHEPRHPETGHRLRDKEGKYLPRVPVQRLRLYPHALRQRNAFYSPTRKAILFGYFPVQVRDANNTPGTIIHTALSHDIIAHEVTHALLDGVHPRFGEATNPDVLAFHEAFADIVALFQHFSYPEVLSAEIARVRGDLVSDNLLGQLAQEFGHSSGHGGALRDALGGVNEETRKWEPLPPDASILDETHEPHERGAVLVAAVFGAYTRIYRDRTADLLRIATNGTGVLEDGALHPDLVGRLAAEATKSARHVLQICIRAIDFCPPVDITFGDYLRALITADVDYAPDDARDYRTAFIESFRQWGIVPRNVRGMSPESLAWPSGEDVFGDTETRNAIKSILSVDAEGLADWNLDSDRDELMKGVDRKAEALWNHFIGNSTVPDLVKARILEGIGLVHHTSKNLVPTVLRSGNKKPPAKGTVATEIHSVRTAIRRNLRGRLVTDLVIEVTQRRAGFATRAQQAEHDGARAPCTSGSKAARKALFNFRRGCTLIIDPEKGELRRIISTPGDVRDDAELDRVRRFIAGGGLEPANAFTDPLAMMSRNEPFAFLHAHEED